MVMIVLLMRTFMKIGFVPQFRGVPGAAGGAGGDGLVSGDFGPAEIGR